MVNRINRFFKDTKKRRYTRIAAFVVFGISLGALIANEVVLPRMAPVSVVNEIPPEERKPVTEEEVYTLPKSEPVAISIPDINIQTTFETPLGLNADQSVQVPDSFEKVGWYKHSPTPGELGPSVILGHVDSYKGPAVFFSIGQLEKGDPIEITRADGSVATFHVTGIARYEQEGFPNELVYGDIGHAGLRLVTCSGTYDKAVQRYSHNTVVYAELASPEGANTTATDQSAY